MIWRSRWESVQFDAHVDICDDELKGVEALLEVRKAVAPYLDLQLVAFPQDGLFRSSSAVGN